LYTGITSVTVGADTAATSGISEEPQRKHRAAIVYCP
jgi:hypothetical protein